MIITLDLKPQVSEKLNRVAAQQGISLEKFITDELESKFFYDPTLELTCLGIGESDLSGEDSEAWLMENWGKSL